jgi:spore maturation protein CgeB
VIIIPFKKCKKCGEKVPIKYNQACSSYCSDCGEEHTKAELDTLETFYKFLFIGKKVSDNHFITNLRRELKKRGHQTVKVGKAECIKYVPSYDMVRVMDDKLSISLRPFEYHESPDYIFVEQVYYRFKNDTAFTPVIYHNREYTHFPDMTDPDLLLFGYPCREEVFDYYFPFEYSELKREFKVHDLFNAVNLKLFKGDSEVRIKGLVDVGWSQKYWQFACCNGPTAKMVIEEQERFSNYCKKKGYTTRFDAPIEDHKYRELVKFSEAVLIDGGYFGWLTRRIFEAMALKTMVVIRVYSHEQMAFYEKIGLNDGENCILFQFDYQHDIYDIGSVITKINTGIYDRNKIVENAYKWVSENHSYKKRTDEFLELIKKYLKPRQEYKKTKHWWDN